MFLFNVPLGLKRNLGSLLQVIEVVIKIHLKFHL